MGRIEKGLHTIWAWAVEGKGIRETFKKLWTAFWKELDRILGILAREVLKKKTPIQKNKVFLHTQDNRYGCNQKYICEELLRQGVDVDIVWRCPTKERGGIPESVRAVKAGSFSYYKEIFSSNVVITNSILFKDQAIYLKKGQTLIETWHGSLGIKRFGKHDYKSSWRWVRGAISTGKMTDYCISNSDFETRVYRDTYWKKTPILSYGHPRNDLFFDNCKERRRELRGQLCEEWKVPVETRFVMYAPTFRDSKNFQCYGIDFERLIGSLKERFGGEWCVLLRYHPTLEEVYEQKDIFKKHTDIKMVNVTKYADMQELIAIADVAITDYSSWIYDFILLRRPGFIFATDIEMYNNERGFYYPLEETPFPIATNNNELMENVLSFDDESYQQKVEEFLRGKGCVEDGHASERVVELIRKIIEGEEK